MEGHQKPRQSNCLGGNIHSDLPSRPYDFEEIGLEELWNPGRDSQSLGR